MQIGSTALSKTFEKFDMDGSGSVDIAELQWYLGGDSNAAQKMLSDFDTIHVDGSISFEEWQGYFESLGAVNGESIKSAYA